LAALRDTRTLAEICRDSGVPVAQLEAARDAWLRRQAMLGDQIVAAPVGGAVEIKRDRAGVPHVYAADSGDLFFGLALRWRRIGCGRWTGCAGARWVGRRRSSARPMWRATWRI